MRFNFQTFISNGCHDLNVLCLNLSNIIIIAVKAVDHPCLIHGISKSKAIHLLENYVFGDCGHIKRIKGINIKNRVYNYFDDLIKAKELETKNILINEKKLKTL